MKSHLSTMLVLGLLSFFAPSAHAQKPPEAGYIFPPGGKAGTTIDIHLAGYDWTPDMEFFVQHPRIQLTATGPLGPLLIPGPPYWFGAKGRLPSLPLPCEIPAKLVIPADIPAGPIFWQAANANGTTSVGVFFVGTGTEIVEEENRKTAQLISHLPATVSGRISKIEEVDRYRFVAAKDGPITCDLMARRLGAKFLGMIEIRDISGRVVADLAGTNGSDPSLTFAAKAGMEYTVSIHDADFGGDRSYVYRLTIAPGPKVVGTLPAYGKRGTTTDVEFVGYGVATGSATLESVKRPVVFPATGTALDYRLETPAGTTIHSIPLSDRDELVTNTPSAPGEAKRVGPAWLTDPIAITGVLDQGDAEDRYYCIWKKGEIWSINVDARRIGSPLDVAIRIIGPNGKEIIRNEDLPETTDAGLDFTVPADGFYQLVVCDTAGKSGSRDAIYHLTVRPPEPDFSLQVVAPRTGVHVGGRADLVVTAVRKHGFKGPINCTVNGLPEGVNTHPVLVMTPEKNILHIPLHADRDAATTASFVTVEGRSGATKRTATVKTTINLSPRGPEENQLTQFLVAATLKPLFKGRPVDADTGRKVHRGSTFPADVIVERLDGFNGEVILRMAAQQSYQVQGITGGDVVVPPGVGLAIYPCFMPEWLETSRTSRMGMIAVSQVADPKGKLRWMANEINGFITMTLEGALLKVIAEEPELAVSPAQPFEVRLKVSRLAKLAEPVRLELRLPDELAGQLKADPIVVAVSQESVVLRIVPMANLRGSHTITIRGTAMQDGKYPAVSEASIAVEFVTPAPTR